VLTEAAAILELGVPLYAAGRLVEEGAGNLWLKLRRDWAGTPEALLGSHVSGAMTELEMHGQLRSRGWPQPAEKATPPTIEPYRMISLDWWLDVQRRAKAADAGHPNGNGNGNGNGAGLKAPGEDPADSISDDGDALADEAAEPQDQSFLEIRTLGRIELKQGGVDFAPLMLGKPVIAFIWLYLLVRALTDPELEISRGSFADEFTPGMSVDKQLKRLRDRLDDMVHRDLPEELFSRLKVTRKHVRLDLSKVSIDIVASRRWREPAPRGTASFRAT
jgi:hypothetical protein